LGFVDMAFSRSPDKAADQDLATVHSVLETLQVQADQFAHRSLDLSPIRRACASSATMAPLLGEVGANLEQLWVQMELVRNHVLWWGWWFVRVQGNGGGGAPALQYRTGSAPVAACPPRKRHRRAVQQLQRRLIKSCGEQPQGFQSPDDSC